MKQENKALLIKYLISIAVASVIAVAVFAMQGFFTDDVGVNMQILADGFCVSGGLLSMYAGLLFASRQGALLGLTFALRYTVLTFIPGGRAKQELYKDYRERKMAEMKKSTELHVFLTGIVFLAAGIVFTVIWYVKFYNITG
ncbi:MAG: DUF3899 domain-containing protein [Clostridia bacterium]|nr:DUF3899 domain-containing protein [Clostridia bacterium]